MAFWYECGCDVLCMAGLRARLAQTLREHAGPVWAGSVQNVDLVLLPALSTLI